MKVFLSILLPVFLMASFPDDHQKIDPFFINDFAKPKYTKNGSHFAYLAPDVEGAYNVHVDGVCVTSRPRGITNFYWCPKGDSLIYLYDEKGDRNYHLYEVTLEGKERDLTPFPDISAWFVGFSQDHEILFFRMNREDPKFRDHYQLDLKTGDLSLVPGHMQYRFDSLCDDEGNPKASIHFAPNGEKSIDLWDGESWRLLVRLDENDWYPRLLHFSKDASGKTLLFFMAYKEKNTRSLYSIDLENQELTLLFSHPEYDCFAAHFDPKTGSLQAALTLEGWLKWHCFDPIFAQELAYLQSQKEGDWYLLQRLREGKTWLLSLVSDKRPTCYYRYDLREKVLTLVHEDAPFFQKQRYGVMESFTFFAEDGEKVQGYFLRPQVGEAPFPCVFEVHGGPHTRQTWRFKPMHQEWATQGIASLFINYRGSFGFGKRFLHKSLGHWSSTVLEDLLQGKKFAEEQGWIHPKKSVIKGGSFGGYLALLASGIAPEAFQGVIADFPIVMPSSWIPQEYLIWDFVYEKLFREGSIGALSPLQYTPHITAKLLMTCGVEDLCVLPIHSYKMVESLSIYQIPHTFVAFTGDGHGYLHPKNRKEYDSLVETLVQEVLFNP
ncbi:MAG: prolyl oligopeptidase family serine peptidase [Chlamydiota bacterium]